ncbi:AraC family transcriptional regulator [Paenibacillus sp. ACRRX]|uniref:AraC family transcriptional regulator n=1 Tax=unclassified Paenibacillus TaxID=185978 RepID=UPI001EF66236|nr:MULTISPECIES: AraC family transcriptional regulator [unclassified Paenibacillus]MCG7407325.1 AraC family transcriptional regulator [Paenibacillus sp. ACRRX]MDK8180551.1 AraC family transcriptional regulator [Paenibacillus sp. UMB4589-SE434]
MKERNYQPDFHHNFNQFFDVLQLDRSDRARTESMAFHAQLGHGSIHRYVPRMDMEVIISEYQFHQQHHISLYANNPMVELSYCVKGRRAVSIGGSEHEVVPGTCMLQFIDDVQVHFEFDSSQPFYMVSMAIPVATFHHFIEQANGDRAIEFKDIMDRRPYRMFNQMIQPADSILLNRIIRASQLPSTRNIEMECGVLELLSSAFRSFLLEGQAESSKLTRSDMNMLKHARDIMLQQMINPPTLLELSRMIGMNDYKLKIGFKEMYGNTVFGYLREKRLEKAFLLLQEGNVNVTEACCAVGYSNPSYFAEAFRDKYGINPGEFVRRI